MGVLGVWGTLLTGTLVFVWRRPLPLQLKIITARIVAQAGLLSGAAGFGLAAYLSSTSDDAARTKVASSSWKLRDYSVPTDVAAAQPVAQAAAAQLK